MGLTTLKMLRWVRLDSERLIAELGHNGSDFLTAFTHQKATLFTKMSALNFKRLQTTLPPSQVLFSFFPTKVHLIFLNVLLVSQCFFIPAGVYYFFNPLLSRCSFVSSASLRPTACLYRCLRPPVVLYNLLCVFFSSMYIFGGFSGLLLNDVLAYTPPSCLAFSNPTSCAAAGPGLRCLWVQSRCIPWEPKPPEYTLPATFCPARPGKSSAQLILCRVCL